MADAIDHGPSAQREPDPSSLSPDPSFRRRLTALLSISTLLSISSLCASLPFLGATSLFQTPFLCLSTGVYSRGLWQKRRSTPRDDESVMPGHDQPIGGTGEANEATALLPQPAATPSPIVWPVDWKDVERGQSLTGRWTLTSMLVIALCSILTYASNVPGADGSGGEGVSVWLYVAWVEAICDSLQACTMALVTISCSREVGRTSHEYDRIHPEGANTVSEGENPLPYTEE
ncbi:hypothetical protein FA13DRAFT_1717539 [Coprinellus micaceus]|uniref:Uncharacterized protein n=1 Tax=Coprinellus micaceus TaxID=71717 RepID=A0A4Y7SG80_COPMI|nr:hypothetical protein FA13DRAFT_1717539 [Coprinellus micaceus]